MFHEVTRKLALAATSTAPGVDYSMGVALEDHNAASFQFHVISADGSFTSAVVQLQGSNDLCNWEDISGASASTSSAPDFKVYSGTGVVPWAFVRLRYTVTTVSNRQVMLKAAIELFQQG